MAGGCDAYVDVEAMYGVAPATQRHADAAAMGTHNLFDDMRTMSFEILALLRPTFSAAPVLLSLLQFSDHSSPSAGRPLVALCLPDGASNLLPPTARPSLRHRRHTRRPQVVTVASSPPPRPWETRMTDHGRERERLKHLSKPCGLVNQGLM
ncbi:hypothetical protein BRADI_3g50868v3 [Brachypodium distachyon]|uniref:Uncharacterized protein n=1 Tax=Brachypodium distachyon TaxID=15368 RepID=A0A2K2D4I2_BRADI|nr:hypothetical protein BRADI_3g50868v3 [Brachypodium distachyon]